jgi:hemoglobin
MADIRSRHDIELLLRHFYGRAFDDPLLADPFSELKAGGLESHLAVMCDFWETVLFRAGRYRGNALVVHRRLHDRHPLHDEHFTRWLQLWVGAIDDLYAGPAADRAKLQATRIAGSMHRRLNGCVTAELESPVK